MESQVNRFKGLRELAELLIRENRLDDACDILRECQGESKLLDKGASLFLIAIMKNCKTLKQCRKASWLVNEFCPRVTSLRRKCLIINQLKMHAKFSDMDGWNTVLTSLPRLESAGLIKDGFRPLVESLQREDCLLDPD